ncbi:MAG: Fic family protein, partial [Bacteroidota bacterium]
IKSLHSSLAIEGNRLTQEQVTDIINGQRVLAAPKDILEVKNAIRVYDSLPGIDPNSEAQLLKTHALLMDGLVADAGKYRNTGVGVFDGGKVVHMAPPAKRVPILMMDLFDYLVNHEEDIIIKSCVFHYEFEFIHPFSDGNGRMGRLWQTAILKSEYPDLVALPIERIVHERQQEYYDALAESQRAGNSNPFITYSLSTIHDALQRELSHNTQLTQDFRDRLEAWKIRIDQVDFTRKEYMAFHKSISPATATRDLTQGVENGILKRFGTMRTTRYSFKS